MVDRSYGDAEVRRDRERWRLSSACSGGFYGAVAEESRETAMANIQTPVKDETRRQTEMINNRASRC